MKKIVPDPPHSTSSRKIITAPHYTLSDNLTPEDSLVIASELLRGVYETTDEYCRSHFEEPGQGMLVNALHSTETAKALIEHALAKMQTGEHRETTA
ncbi:hypothetical protein PS627_02845 [Pseudomonas fluorescens]|uniref:hypothetical protein n=1 Tax=Pseudomonas fluorescens TaxID=294 RepID=UPI0012544EC1|nr:hypothetical protein [Pseudomonas fluorescens]CAG8868082.1 hypothetical protein PS627_02845 [Pseudomonas fluorescens]